MGGMTGTSKMTVKELIDFLKQYPDNMKILVNANSRVSFSYNEWGNKPFISIIGY